MMRTPRWTWCVVVPAFLVATISLPAALESQTAPLLELSEAIPTDLQPAAGPPLRIAERFGVVPLASLLPAEVGAADQLEAVRAWNAAGSLPLRNGFARPLPLPRLVRFEGPDLQSRLGMFQGGTLGQSGPSTYVWGGEIVVADADRLRLHLADVKLPASARLWVYGENGEAVGPFGRELIHEGSLWTPSVGGPSIRLEVELTEPGQMGPAGFVVDRVLELVRLDPGGAPTPSKLEPKVDPSCLVDATCAQPADFPAIDAARKAIAQLFYIKGQFGFVCSGGLLNDLALP